MVCNSRESVVTDEAALMGLLDLVVLSTLGRSYNMPDLSAFPGLAE